LAYYALRNAVRVMIKLFSCRDTQALRGDRKGQWSIRVNDQWRICFKFKSGDVLRPVEVDIALPVRSHSMIFHLIFIIPYYKVRKR
jgi:hypothetical protein